MTEETETIVDLTPGKVEANETTETAIVKQETRELSRPSSTPILSNIGDLCSRIKIAYSVSSNMPEDAIEGSLVINNDNLGWSTILPAGHKEPLKVLIMGARIYYKEWLTSEQFMAGDRPKVYATKEEAIRDGQTTDWGPNPGERPTVSQAIDLHLLVKKNDVVQGADGKFFLAIEDEEYAPCIMTIDKGAVKTVLPFLKSLTLVDATTRKVHPSLARPDSYFCALRVNAVPMAKNPARKARVPNFTVLLDKDHRKVCPSEDFREQLRAITDMFNTPPPVDETNQEDGFPF